MKKLLFVVTSIVLAAGIIYTAGSKEQPNKLVEKDSENLLARMGDPGGGMG
ncbi:MULTISPECIES: hypothetical protein [Bacillus cereus group]|uniref:hypothetical protein n=1 Tax=Bacillus cereus group TaxID=86661 RepID=UPI00159696EE|nr:MULTISPECIES: hypothetical protein [Bacillus cereus group]